MKSLAIVSWTMKTTKETVRGASYSSANLSSNQGNTILILAILCENFLNYIVSKKANQFLRDNDTRERRCKDW